MKIFARVDEVSETGHRPPLPVCVGCSVRLDGEQASPGDIVVCIYCASIQLFGGDLQFPR
jgi:hypothetical protein